MIEAEKLTKRYGDKTAVDGISFAIAPGSVTGFLGPNGAGKSTTMRMVMGLDRPTSGSVNVGGAGMSRPAGGGGRSAGCVSACGAGPRTAPIHRCARARAGTTRGAGRRRITHSATARLITQPAPAKRALLVSPLPTIASPIPSVNT
jgi:ABC-2 type transport system ATP-binding protein